MWQSLTKEGLREVAGIKNTLCAGAIVVGAKYYSSGGKKLTPKYLSFN